VPGPLATGPRLGYRGEVEFDGETWLRHRIYEPASRSLAQPDPLLPVPATASAANPYHYAANNPIGLSDPLGLRPVTDEELRAARNHMGRNPLQTLGDEVVETVKDVGEFTYRHAGALSAVAGTLALIPPLTPFLAPVSIGLGIVSGVQSYTHHDYLGVAFDAAAIVPGVGGYLRGARAMNALRAAEAEDALRTSLSLHPSIRGEVSHVWKSQIDAKVAKAEASHEVGRMMDEQAAGVTSAAAIRAETMPGHEHETHNPLEYRDRQVPKPVRLTPVHP
jgi:RHS repeat-associated protein